ncbi:DUF2075 domain-containing protein [Sulfurospirillum sp. 'SP']|nr:zonular occludens toxin domain-containing protein [Sulfurospirillum sp. 'SP']WNY98270.1 DUF2075 domain-containing protein [Sulfurospirillum sp. 'SP']
MVYLIIGVPGSGKTYKAVYDVYKEITSEKKKYKHIYTNINGFNYDKANEVAQIQDYVKPFEFHDLNTHIMDEYEFFTAQKEKKSRKIPKIALKTDDVQSPVLEEESIIDYDEACKQKGIYAPFFDSLIIIDECHLYFEDKTDEPKIRFLSYHRHFNIDIVLITQGKNLIHKKYLSFVESMYKALPGAKRIFSTRFRYRHYASYQEYSQNIIGTISISLEPKVSELYNSGANKISPSMLKKFLLPLIGLLFLTFLGYKNFISERYSNQTQEPQPVQNAPIEQQTSQPTEPQQPKQKEVNLDEKDTSKNPFFAVRCFRKSCNFKGIDYSFDENTMYKFINAFNCKVIIPDNTDPLFTLYVLRCHKDLQKVIDLYSKNSTSSRTVQNEETSLNPIVSK